jgi:tetratricopeptide (TPR) repeat protein/serine/threonine protein kinase
MTERDLFIAALQKDDPADRQAFLDGACAGQPVLREQVEELLRLHENAETFLQQPARAEGDTSDHLGPGRSIDPTGPPHPGEGPGTLIGPYRLMEQIGEGGMGLVFVAEQQQPVRRKVALKVIKPGMDSKQVVARFEAERQALALMDHPNIAQVHDGGTTPAGRPYFVMELVKGVPITEYCDQNQVPVRERLGLFVHVCQAVQHAHQKGIIHRDLKPSNVLVMSQDGTPVVKVIDFGVAKAVGQQLTDKTVYTHFAQLVGTPLYMSPEQAGQSGLDVDTRSDVYSLGVLLYELLTGTTPFTRERLKDVGFDELRRIIREEEPPRPSTRISTLGEGATTVSANRRSQPKRLSQLFRGELDWVVMKALEKDRNRRYESASALARDVERYLADEPVRACPPSAAYRLRKFLRRKKGPVLVGAAVVLALLVALGGIAAGIGWAVRDRSAHRAAAERQVREDLVEATPLLPTTRWPAAAAFVRRAQTALAGVEIDPALAGQVEELARDLEMARRLEEAWVHPRWGDNDLQEMQAAFAGAFGWYGLDVDQMDPREAAERVRARPIRPQLAAGLDQWAFVRMALKLPGGSRLLAASRAADPDAVRDRLRDLLARVRTDPWGVKERAMALAGADLPPATAVLLAILCRDAGAPERAAAALHRARLQHPEDYHLNFGLGTAHLSSRPPRLEEAIRFLTAAVSLRPESSFSHNNLGKALAEGGRHDEAIAEYHEALRLNPKYALAHSNLGGALQLKGRLDEAVTACREAIRLDPGLAKAHHNLGMALRQQRKLKEAVACFRKAIDLDPKYAESHVGLGGALAKQGQLDEARACFDRALELDPKNAGAHVSIGMTLGRQGKLGEAIAWYRKALKLDPKVPHAHGNLGLVLLSQKKVDEAVACFHRALELDPTLAESHNGLGCALAFQGKLDAALVHFRKGHELDPKNAHIYANLCKGLSDQGKFGEVIAVYKKVLERDPGKLDVQNALAWTLATCPEPRLRNAAEAVQLAEAAVRQAPGDGNLWNTLGVARYRAGDWKGAREALGQSMRLQQGGSAADWFFLAMTHWKLGQKDQARTWYDRAVQGMAKNDPHNEELGRFRAEAKELLGIQNQPQKPRGTEKLPGQ